MVFKTIEELLETLKIDTSDRLYYLIINENKLKAFDGWYTTFYYNADDRSDAVVLNSRIKNDYGGRYKIGNSMYDMFMSANKLNNVQVRNASYDYIQISSDDKDRVILYINLISSTKIKKLIKFFGEDIVRLLFRNIYIDQEILEP